MSEDIIIIGAATPTIIRLIDDINHKTHRKINILGFLDNIVSKEKKDFFGFTILGGFEAIKKHNPSQINLINTIAGTIQKRIETTEFFLKLGYQFTNIVHPNVNIERVKMGNGNLIYENALIQPFVELGNHCVVSSNAGIAHETVIGDYCFIGPASYICGKVSIKENVFIGCGAKILPRLTIGKNVQISASALVNKSIENNKKIQGIPGREV